jgi:DNA-binding NtrC family response regulator
MFCDQSAKSSGQTRRRTQPHCAQAPQLLLFGNGCPGTERRLCSALRQLGYSFVREKPDAVPDLARIYIGVMLTDADTQAVRRHLDDLGPGRRRLLAVVPRELPIDHELLSRCDEVIFAPFSSEELELRLRRLVSPLRQHGEISSATPLIGQAPAFCEVLRLVRKLAACDMTVLIEGETGTGKELIARALHDLNPHRLGAFVPINCGALPDGMLENELFGHRAGAFTDARMAASGLVEQAEGGTLFLDEIDALSLHAQAALLRFLQNKEYRRLGGDTLRRIRTRVVAASNTPLLKLTAERRFRTDLYFRLEVGRVLMPPLRDRPGDASRLAQYFLDCLNTDRHSPLRFSSAALAWIDAHPWAGNVRELQSFVERQSILTDGLVIEPPLLVPVVPASPERLRQVKAAALMAAEANYLRRVMGEANGNVSAAARQAGTGC